MSLHTLTIMVLVLLKEAVHWNIWGIIHYCRLKYLSVGCFPQTNFLIQSSDHPLPHFWIQQLEDRGRERLAQFPHRGRWKQEQEVEGHKSDACSRPWAEVQKLPETLSGFCKNRSTNWRQHSGTPSNSLASRGGADRAAAGCVEAVWRRTTSSSFVLPPWQGKAGWWDITSFSFLLFYLEKQRSEGRSQRGTGNGCGIWARQQVIIIFSIHYT